MTFRSFLSAWRESWGLTHVVFAKKIGISPSNRCEIEKGRQLVSAKKAAEIAGKIGCSKTRLVELALNKQLQADGLKMRAKTEVVCFDGLLLGDMLSPKTVIFRQSSLEVLENLQNFVAIAA